MDNTQLALSIPGFIGEIQNNPASNFPTGSTTLGTVLTSFGEVALYIGGFMMFFWAVWGVFDYLKAEGNKEALAKARKKIQWAIVGFIILLMTFFIGDYIQPIFAPSNQNITIIKNPKTP